jgi:hypothetical protein
VTVTVNPAGGRFHVDRGEWQAIDGTSFQVQLGEHAVELEIDNPCCQRETRALDRNAGADALMFTLQFLPARVKPICNIKDADTVSVQINDGTYKVGDVVTLPFAANATSSTKTVTVQFLSDRQRGALLHVQVTAAKTIEVPCDLR